MSGVLKTFDYEGVTSAKAFDDLATELGPYAFQNQPQWDNETGDDYAARCQADFEQYKIRMLRRSATGSRGAMVLAIKDHFISGHYVSSTLYKINSGKPNPDGWFDDLLDYFEIGEALSAAQKSLMKHTIQTVIPQCERFGFKVTDSALIALFDESGKVSISNVVRYAVALINKRIKQDAGVTKDDAKLVYNALVGNDDDLKKLKVASAGGQLPIANGGRIPAQCFIEGSTLRYEIVIDNERHDLQAILERVLDVNPYGQADSSSDGDSE